MATNTTATTQTHNGTGSQANFAISFSFLADSEVDVTVGGVLKTLGTHYTISGSTLTFTSGNIPPSGTGNIKFTRDTNISTKKVDFTDGSVLTEIDLDTNADQILFAQQEITDKLSGIEENATADQTNAEIKTAYEANSDTNAFTDALQSKLNAIESGATADQTNAEIRAAVEAATDSNVFTDADHTKLNNIEANATADQTNAEIKTAYEANSDTNAFTDAEKTKLSGIETSADVTDTTNVDAAGAVMNTDTSTSAMNFVVDEDNMSSNSDTKVPTQQSVKAYVDANSGGGGAVDSVSGSAPIVSSGGTTPAISITAATTSAAGSMSSTDKTKLDAIEANADVTDATNVDAAGAVMNSDLDGKGELLVGDGSGDPTALAVGTNGYILKANSSTATGIEWAAAGAGGDVNQNAFSTIAVSGQSNVAADSTTDTLNIAAGTNVTITTDPSTDTVTITSTDTNTTYSVGDGGLTQNNFTDALKTKLDGISANANVGLTDIVSDTTPQLGGNLDVQAFEVITATTNGNIKLTANGTGFVEVKGNTNAGTIQLNCESNSHGVKLQSPAHSAAQSYTLILPDNQVAADKFLKVKSISGSGATAVGQLEFADASGGSSIGGDTGVDFNDNINVRFGASNDGVISYISSDDAFTISSADGADIKIDSDDDLTIECDDDMKIISGDSIQLRHGSSASSEAMIICNDDSSVQLYHNNSLKIETESTGASITGNLNVSADIRDSSGNHGSTAAEIFDGRAKVYINFDGTGTISIRGSIGVSSISDTNTGKYVVTFSSSFSNINYVALATVGNDSSSSAIGSVEIIEPTTADLELFVEDVDSAFTDEDYVYVVIFAQE